MNSLFNKAAKLAAAVAAPVFQYRGWTWAHHVLLEPTEDYIPSARDIQNTIVDLLNKAAESGGSRTGRLAVEREDDEDGTPVMYNIMLEIGHVFCYDDGEPESVMVD
jgi:hypothetical protein